ncbi:TetR/AcrR family transcriptional regulator [Klenkia taihuensis]|uniref:Transcriptional regulator, TetR family n=1 Tax=Klenkia taihuensis TaxID=1225127 RepID=A0A1I1GJB9_9ACTN|nr:TetR/AcrR family transcriptional regulator [Klenkia taihuensis]GHE09715.1 TetR family transcriptional regulator [Klenkia taihuensis]SFC11644.1 transcriptional regulator, TetR family [Klenkia taihuensis]
MAQQDWRALKRDATRRRLTESAYELIAEHGYEAVSVADIAEAADVSVPTFYAYFRTKEHVVLPDQDLAWISGHLSRTPADLPLPERIRVGLHAIVAEIEQHARAESIRRWELVRAEPALRRRAYERERASAGALAEVLGVDLATSEGAADVVVLSACLSASTTAFLRWAGTSGTRPLVELIDEAFTALRSI